VVGKRFKVRGPATKSQGTNKIAMSNPVKNTEQLVDFNGKGKYSKPEIVSSAISLLKDHSLLEQLSLTALSFSRQLPWGTTTDILGKLLLKLSLIKYSSDKESNKLCLESVR
jgi:hypothetical protein